MKTASRYELKYLISDSQAEAIQRMVSVYLRPDEHTSTDALGYRVRSLYLDSRDFACYSQTCQGEKNRFKLRIRFYDESPTSPVFLEIKARVANVIQKKRAMVSRQVAQLVLRGASVPGSMLLNDVASERIAMREFCRLRDQIAAVGKVYVDYCRQAFECSRGRYERVTFDRNVRASSYVPGSELKIPVDSQMTRIEQVVMEMKFINQPADWMIELARRFGLQATSVPKYIEGVNILRETNPNCPQVSRNVETN